MFERFPERIKTLRFEKNTLFTPLIVMIAPFSILLFSYFAYPKLSEAAVFGCLIGSDRSVREHPSPLRRPEWSWPPIRP